MADFRKVAEYLDVCYESWKGVLDEYDCLLRTLRSLSAHPSRALAQQFDEMKSSLDERRAQLDQLFEDNLCRAQTGQLVEDTPPVAVELGANLSKLMRAVWAESAGGTSSLMLQPSTVQSTTGTSSPFSAAKINTASASPSSSSLKSVSDQPQIPVTRQLPHSNSLLTVSVDSPVRRPLIVEENRAKIFEAPGANIYARPGGLMGIDGFDIETDDTDSESSGEQQSYPLSEHQLEAVQYFIDLLLHKYRGQKFVSLNTLFGNLSQASKEIRDIVGSKPGFSLFFVALPKFFVLSIDYQNVALADDYKNELQFQLSTRHGASQDETQDERESDMAEQVATTRPFPPGFTPITSQSASKLVSQQVPGRSLLDIDDEDEDSENESRGRMVGASRQQDDCYAEDDTLPARNPFISTNRAFPPQVTAVARNLDQTPPLPFHATMEQIRSWRYKTKMCDGFILDIACPHGSKCIFAHGESELRPFRKLYSCELLLKFGWCGKGATCQYAHSESELGLTLEECQVDVQPPSQPTLTLKPAPVVEKPHWGVKNPSESPSYDDTDDLCAICIQQMFSNKPDMLTETSKCRHRFHKFCLKEWMKRNSTCPKCRQAVVDEDDYPALRK